MNFLTHQLPNQSTSQPINFSTHQLPKPINFSIHWNMFICQLPIAASDGRSGRLDDPSYFPSKIYMAYLQAVDNVSIKYICFFHVFHDLDV